MGNQSSDETTVFRAGKELYLLIGIPAGIFLAVAGVVGIRRGDWEMFIFIGVATIVLFLLLRILRLEFRPDGFKYRNLSGSRNVAYADVERAYFDVLRSEYTPQGVAAFWVERQDGSRVKVNLRTFSLQASAVLFTELEAHGIPIEVPDAWAARRMAEQIRTEQAKRLRGSRPA